MSHASFATPRLPPLAFPQTRTVRHFARLTREVGEIVFQSAAVALTLWLLVAAPGLLHDAAGTVAARSHVTHR